MPRKISKLSIYTPKHLPNRGLLDFRDEESLQSNLAYTPLSYATLILHGSRQGVAEPLNAELVCASFPGELKTRHGFHEKNQYRGPSRANFPPGHPYLAINEWGEVSTTLSLLHLLWAGIRVEIKLNWHLENTMIPSAATPGILALCAALTIASKRLRAVTLCLSSKALLAFGVRG